MSFESLCPCPPDAVSTDAAEEARMRDLLTRNRTIEKREVVVTNTYQKFVTNMFKNKSTPYAKRFD